MCYIYSEWFPIVFDIKNDLHYQLPSSFSCRLSQCIYQNFFILSNFTTLWSLGLYQVFNEINSRDMEKINVFRGIFSSWIFLSIIFFTAVFQVIIVEFLGAFASTVPLSWQFWLLSVLLGAASMIVAVIIKSIPVDKATTTKHHDGYEQLPSGPDLA